LVTEFLLTTVNIRTKLPLIGELVNGTGEDCSICKEIVVENCRLAGERKKYSCDIFGQAVKRAEDQGEKTMEEQRPVPGQVQIKADEKELQGQYSNLVMVHHNLEEFTLNFVYIFPNGAQGKLLTSVIVSPGHAKRIWRALGENISRYETQFGPIKEAPEGSGQPPNVGFVQ
jgi:hypothetical protein